MTYIVAGLIKKDSGHVCLLGSEVGDTDFLHRRKMGFVLDRPLYFDKLTAREYLEFVAGMYGLPDQEAADKIDELIEFFDLSGHARDSFIESYSKGMKQKVAIAAAIIHEPELLILDEPFDGIDVPSSEAIRRVLLQMAKQGTTTLITSHNLDLVESLCTDYAIVDRGSVVHQGRMSNLESTLKELGKSADSQSLLGDVFLKVTSTEPEGKVLSWLKREKLE